VADLKSKIHVETMIAAMNNVAVQTQLEYIDGGHYYVPVQVNIDQGTSMLASTDLTELMRGENVEDLIAMERNLIIRAPK
jgi:hypothetical protein